MLFIFRKITDSASQSHVGKIKKREYNEPRMSNEENWENKNT